MVEELDKAFDLIADRDGDDDYSGGPLVATTVGADTFNVDVTELLAGITIDAKAGLVTATDGNSVSGNESASLTHDTADNRPLYYVLAYIERVH